MISAIKQIIQNLLRNPEDVLPRLSSAVIEIHDGGASDYLAVFLDLVAPQPFTWTAARLVRKRADFMITVFLATPVHSASVVESEILA